MCSCITHLKKNLILCKYIKILRDRLEIDFNLKTKIGKMRVAYRESIEEKAALASRFESVRAGKPVFCHLEFSIEKKEPVLDEEEDAKDDKLNENEIELHFQRDPDFDIYYREFKRRAENIRKKRKQDSDWEDKDEKEGEESAEQSNSENSILGSLKYIKNNSKPVEVVSLIGRYSKKKIVYIYIFIKGRGGHTFKF